MDPAVELSRSYLFNVKDGHLVMADQSANGSREPDRMPDSIVDQKYQILSLLGKGGMGAVYRARHLMLGKEVALKTFRSGSLTDEACIRFQREAQSIAKLTHKNVIQVFDFGLSQDGVPYYTMEYLTGQCLTDKLQKNGPLAVNEAIDLFVQICQGLSLAHGKGIIHRDLKPGNLFIESSPSAKGSIDTVKIVDFGLASLTDQTVAGQRLTSKDTVIGTPLYMSPEQSMGQQITERADIYSLGCTLFEALTGRPPFCGTNPLDTAIMHESAKVPTLKHASEGRTYPPALEFAVATMLAKAPGDRQSSMDQVAEVLLHLRSDPDTFSGSNVLKFSSMPEADDATATGANAVDTANASDPADPAYISDSGLRGRTSVRRTTRTPVAVEAEDPPKHTAQLAGPLIAILLVFVLGATYYVVNTAQAKKSVLTASPAAPQPSWQSSAQPTSQPASKLAPKPTFKPYCQLEKNADGKNNLVFHFPDDLDLGTFKNARPPNGQKRARGEISWPANTQTTFEPSSDFLNHPEYLDVFQPNYLYGLDLKNGSINQIESELMHHIGQLTGLHVLNITQGYIGNEDVGEIKNLPALTTLSINNTSILGLSLANIPQIKQLTSFSFGNSQGARYVIAALHGSDKIEELCLDGDPLLAPDFKAIGTLANLRVLKVSNCGMQSSDLASLVPLTKLTTLVAEDCKIAHKSIESLKMMRKNHLKYVTLNGEGLSQEDSEIMKGEVPWVKPIESDNTGSKPGASSGGVRLR